MPPRPSHEGAGSKLGAARRRCGRVLRTAVDRILAAENAAGEVLWGVPDHDGTVRGVVGHDGQQTVEVDAASVGSAG